MSSRASPHAATPPQPPPARHGGAPSSSSNHSPRAALEAPHSISRSSSQEEEESSGGSSEGGDTPTTVGSGSDFEETLLRQAGKRGTPPTLITPTRPGAKRLRKEACHSSDAQRPTGAGNLFEAVKRGRSITESVVDEWLESYQEDRELGFLELVNFLVQSCGCRGVVTYEMLKSLQNSQIIQQLTESFDEDSAEYPLSLSAPAWWRFQRGFCEVMAILVDRTQYDVVYDEYLMDSLVALLTGLSDSQVRAFRHTSTLAAMKLMTGLVHVAVSINLQKDNNQRQYEAEWAKGVNRRAPEKLEGLLEQRREGVPESLNFLARPPAMEERTYSSTTFPTEGIVAFAYMTKGERGHVPS